MNSSLMEFHNIFNCLKAFNDDDDDDDEKVFHAIVSVQKYRRQYNRIKR